MLQYTEPMPDANPISDANPMPDSRQNRATRFHSLFLLLAFLVVFSGCDLADADKDDPDGIAMRELSPQEKILVDAAGPGTTASVQILTFQKHFAKGAVFCSQSERRCRQTIQVFMYIVIVFCKLPARFGHTHENQIGIPRTLFHNIVENAAF